MGAAAAFLRERLPEVLRSMSPLVAAVVVLQFTIVDAPTGAFLRFIAGAVLCVAGLLFLFAGIEHGIVPMGRYVGAELPRRRSIPLILAVVGALGFVTTAVEPDVLVLASQVESLGASLAGRGLVYAIAGGVGVAVAVGIWCVVRGKSLTVPLAGAFAALAILAPLAPADLVPVAYDGGSVTTGILSAPVVLALALGLSAVLARQPGTLGGFGILGLASVGPILLLLLLGWIL